jgi:hypothetical protein
MGELLAMFVVGLACLIAGLVFGFIQGRRFQWEELCARERNIAVLEKIWGFNGYEDRRAWLMTQPLGYRGSTPGDNDAA